jgi:hypothetical protein
MFILYTRHLLCSFISANLGSMLCTVDQHFILAFLACSLDSKVYDFFAIYIHFVVLTTHWICKVRQPDVF